MTIGLEYTARRCPTALEVSRGDYPMGIGFAVFAGTSPEVIGTSAKEAQRLGYSSFWVNHPGATDGLAALAIAARETQRIELGIGVIPLHTRGPESIVQGVKSTGLPLDRLLLGVRSPHPEALKRVPGASACARASACCGVSSRRGSSWPRSGRRCAAWLARSPTACSSTG